LVDIILIFEMKKLPFILRMIFVIFVLLILIFITLVIYPFATNNFVVYRPEPNSVKYVMNGTDLDMVVPLHILNRGFFKIDKVIINYSIWNVSELLFNGSHEIYNIMGNFYTNISIVANLSKFLNNNETYFIFHNTNLTMLIKISGTYAYGIINYTLNMSLAYYWNALIESINVGEYSILEKNNSYQLELPFHFSSASFLKGNITQDLEILINNTEISSTVLDVPLGTFYSTNIIFILNETQIQEIMKNANSLYIIDELNLFNHYFTYEVKI